MSKKTTFLTSVLVLLLTLPVLGLVRKRVSVKCPVDDFKFNAWSVKSVTHWGGIDSDLCTHELGKIQANSLKVWVCPSCYYAERSEKFENELTDKEKSNLLGHLKPIEKIEKNAKQDMIPGWVKYDLLVQCGNIKGVNTNKLLGEYYLRAAWCARQEGADVLDSFETIDSFRTSYGLNIAPLKFMKKSYGEKYSYNRSLYELEKIKKLDEAIAKPKYKDASHLFALYVAAYIYRRHGEHEMAIKYFTQAKNMAGKNSVLDKAVVRALESIEREMSYQKKSIIYYTKAIEAKEVSGDILIEIQYFIAEMYRRLQDDKAAAIWYDKCIHKGSKYHAMSVLQKQKLKSIETK